MRKVKLGKGSYDLSYCLRASSIFSMPIRKTSTIVMPLAYPNFALIEDHKELLNTFRSLRQEYNNLLHKHLMLGKAKISKMQYLESLNDFLIVIALASGDETSKLTDEQKGMLAEAYTHMAIVLSHGSTDDVNKALAYVNIALELNKNFKIAIECKQGILSEKKAPINIDDSFNVENNLMGIKT